MPDTFPSGAPTSYDDSSMRIVVLQSSVWEMAHSNMQTAIDQIVASWEKIGDTWNDLQLGWVGDSADAASQFNDRLKKVQAELFGVDDKDNPKPGILGLMRGVAMQAADNYDRAESQVRQLFDPFCSPLSADGDDGQPPQNAFDNPIQITYGNV